MGTALPFPHYSQLAHTVMFKGISWSSFFLFMLAAVVLYYVVVGILYYRAELIEFIKRKGRGGESPVAKAQVQPVLVATGSAFAEQEEELVPTPEPHLPAAAVAAAAVLATTGTETSDDPEAKDETTDEGTGKVNSDDLAVADEYENPAERAEEEEIAEAKRLLELGKSSSTAMSDNFNNKELNQNNSSEVGSTHIIAKLANDNPSEPSPPTMAEFVEPVDLNDDTQPLEMIQLADELVVSDTLIGVSDLNNLLDGLATGQIVPEELAEVAPVFSGTELSTRFAANKKRRSQEVESLLSDEE